MPATYQSANNPQNGAAFGASRTLAMQVTPKASRVAPKASKLTLAGPDRLVAWGNQGTAFCLSTPPDGAPTDGTPFQVQYRAFKTLGIDPKEVGALHGRGEPCGFAEWDSCGFVGERGTPTHYAPLSVALASGVLVRVPCIVSRDGVRKVGSVIAPKGWNTGTRQLRCMATEDVPAGRIENHLCGGASDHRNKDYVGKVLPLAFGTKAPAPVTPAPVKSATPPPAKRKVPAPVTPATPATPAKGKKK